MTETPKPWTADPKVIEARKKVSWWGNKRDPQSYLLFETDLDNLLVAVASSCVDAGAEDTRCKWTSDVGEMDGYYTTDCGHAVTFNDGGVKENEVTFCNYCGKRVEEASVQYDDDESDAARQGEGR